MGLEQQLTLWKPLSKNIYSLRLLTRQHQRFQDRVAGAMENPMP
ncbi:hypothetical protein [Spirosoma sp. KNUC1025]|nr:hypothetical protein [Spirosoma sp. KNUC1025]